MTLSKNKHLLDIIKKYQVQQTIACISQEESPGCCEVWFHLKNGQSNLRDSATESKPPQIICGKGERVG